MQFKKIIVQFNAENISLAEELICNIFFSYNVKGVVCDVPLEEPDEGFGTDTLPKPGIYAVTGYLPLVDTSDIIFQGIKKQALSLKDDTININIKTQIVDEKDWADAWKDYFDVTPVTDRITIKPDWKRYTPKKNEIVIHLDPGMAFGTGTHPTTAMCIKLIEKYLVPDSTFLDIGTGSGILMITAAKMGAGHLLGIDTDEVAIRVSRENLSKNKIDVNQYDLKCATLDCTVQTHYDFIAANIIAQVIIDLLPQIVERITKDTIIVLSGIITDRLDGVLENLDKNGLFVIDRQSEDEWVALAVKKKR